VRDFTKKEIEETRPNQTPTYLVDFCLKRLYEDEEHITSEEIVHGLTFEELLGCLLCVRDTSETLSRFLNDDDSNALLSLEI
jgi:hypothetical protein